MRKKTENAAQISLFENWSPSTLVVTSTSEPDDLSAALYDALYVPSEAEYQAASTHPDQIPGLIYPGANLAWTPMFHGATHLGCPPASLWITAFPNGEMWEWFQGCGNAPNEYQFPDLDIAKAAGEFLMGLRTEYDSMLLTQYAVKTPMITIYQQRGKEHGQ